MKKIQVVWSRMVSFKPKAAGPKEVKIHPAIMKKLLEIRLTTPRSIV